MLLQHLQGIIVGLDYHCILALNLTAQQMHIRKPDQLKSVDEIARLMDNRKLWTIVVLPMDSGTLPASSQVKSIIGC